MKKLFLLLLIILGESSLHAQIVNLNFSGIRSAKGSIRIQFFDTKKNFDDEKPVIIKTLSKAAFNKGSLKVTYKDIPTGTYGIAILDDENDNKQMDYGLILPKEGFGFSDYYHSGMTRPDFNKFKFTLGKETKDIQIKLRYL